MKTISVIVPNYNYANFLEQRLITILNQTYPIYELIFLDDNSQDDSIKIAKKVLKNSSIPIKFISNKKNSGNTFKQWYKGLKEAKGEYIWIAEADDYCENNFLQNLITFFDDSNVILAYSQSKIVDQNNKILAPNYLNHTKDISNDWEKDFIIDGIIELYRSFYYKNIIPNASAILFKKTSLLDVFEKHKNNIFNFKLSGDWYIYTILTTYGKFAFCSKPLNYHRTHIQTNRKKIISLDILKEVEIIKHKIIKLLKENYENNHINYKKLSKNLINIIKTELSLKNDILDILQKIAQSQKIAIFGLGASGKLTYNFIKQYYPEKIKYFIDDNIKGKYEGISIITTSQFLSNQKEIDILLYGKYQSLNNSLLQNIKIPFFKLENIT